MTMTSNVSRHTYRTPANIVTLVRILLTPVVIAVIYLYAPSWWVLAFSFAVTFTDRIDGWLARRYGTSKVGTFLDPLSDKFIVLGCYFALVALGWVSIIPVVLIAVREVAMQVWRSQLAKQGVSVPARQSGKYKMWAQSLAVALALIPGVIANFSWLFTSAVWFAVGFTYWSFVQYIVDARRFGHPTGAATKS